MPGCPLAPSLPVLPTAHSARERQINENFAQLEERRFVRALLPIPVLGGKEFRIGHPL